MGYIIAVASPIGGGKTSLVNAIANKLENATTIYYDHFERGTEKTVNDLVGWMNSGADFNDFSAPGLGVALEMLKRGEPAFDPLTKSNIPPQKYVIFEMPLGREHRDTARYIDLLIWIDTPQDVAFARKIKEYTRIFLAEFGHDIANCMMWLDRYLDNYLKGVADVLEIQRQKVSAQADIRLDGRTDPETMASQAIQEILKKLPAD